MLKAKESFHHSVLDEVEYGEKRGVPLEEVHKLFPNGFYGKFLFPPTFLMFWLNGKHP